MRAVITGATSGLGLEFARILNEMGYELTLIARRKDRLEKLKEKYGSTTQIIQADLSVYKEVLRVTKEIDIKNVDILINNAGFGLCGDFLDTDMERELEMISLNVAAVYGLTKIFLTEFEKKNKGYILNVASVASFFPGPLLSVYYATKAFVKTLTLSIKGELKSDNSDVYVGILCPGPVKTEFDNVAGVRFSLKGADASQISEYAIAKMFKGKTVILPTFSVKLAVFFGRLLPESLLARITYSVQAKKLL